MIVYNFIKYLWLSIKYGRILSRVCKEEKLVEGLSNLLGFPVKTDWIGRLYVVVNPFIKEGKFNDDNRIFEMGDDGYSKSMVENFIMSRISVVDKFIRAQNLFDLLAFKLDKIDDNYNYLFVMFPIPYVELKVWAKRFGWLMLGLLVIGAICASYFCGIF